jgi:RNA:NAD 2'-phosphotransferase (TPT1/KptA family)
MEEVEQIEQVGVTGAPESTQQEVKPPRSKRFESSIVKTSKTVSYLLRHGAKKEGLSMRLDGYVKVEDLVLQTSQIASKH